MPDQTTAPARSLIRKLAEVMAEVERIPKNGYNQHFSYRYVMEADLVEALRTKLAEKSVFIFTSVESSSKQGDITEVHTLHTFVDGGTGEQFSVHGYGQGQDKGDKGGYKAMTGAMKYFLLKTFLVSTGDDPEQEEKPAKPAPRQVPPAKSVAKATAKPAPKPATPQQIAEINRLCAELGMDAKKDIFTPLKVQTPSFDQALQIIEKLQAKLSKQLDELAKLNS